MTPASIFQIHLALGYVPWLLVCGAYFWPWLWSVDRATAHSAIAALHSFRFFGLAFLVPGVVSPDLPASFADFAAYGDFATGLLAMGALLAVRVRPLFWVLVVAFNVVGAADILVVYLHGIQMGLPERAGELGATYAIPVLYVPLLMITHATALFLMLRGRRVAVPALSTPAAPSRAT